MLNLTVKRSNIGLFLFAAGLVCLASASTTLASDPVGIYAIVDKVVLEPGEAAPERIQIWGTFSLAVGRGYAYAEPKTGYMYFTAPEGKLDVCRKEWKDLKELAGTKQALGFGFRHESKGRVRAVDEKIKDPENFPIAMGLQKVRRTDYEPIQKLQQAHEKSRTKAQATAKNLKVASAN